MELQKILFTSPCKLQAEQIFMKTNGSSDLCIIAPYSKNMTKEVSLYTKYHNKSILAELFCDTLAIKDRKNILDTFIENIDGMQIINKLLPMLIIKPPTYQQQPNIPEYKPAQNQSVNKTAINKTSLGGSNPSKSNSNKLNIK